MAEAVAAKAKPKKKVKSWEQKKKTIGYVFTLPFIIGAFFFLLLPVITSLIYSFSNLNVSQSGYILENVGFEHYNYLFRVDPYFIRNIGTMLLDTMPNVIVALIFSFFIASLLNQKFHGRALVRGIFFMPVILSSGIYTQLQSGDVLSNQISSSAQAAASGAGSVTAAFSTTLASMGLSGGIADFLLNSVNRISVIVSMSAIPIIIFLAGFQSISPSIFEASYIEGATKWEVFWKISFPMVSPQILVSLVYIIIDSFTTSTNSMIQSIHTVTFNQMQYGRGAAMAWIYMLAIFIIIGICFFIVNRLVFYYD